MIGKSLKINIFIQRYEFLFSSFFLPLLSFVSRSQDIVNCICVKRKYGGMNPYSIKTKKLKGYFVSVKLQFTIAVTRRHRFKVKVTVCVDVIRKFLKEGICTQNM